MRMFFSSISIEFVDGNKGMEAGSCSNREESSPLDDTSKSLVLVNHFNTAPIKLLTCENNSADLINMLITCYGSAGNRWANFVAVDFYKVLPLAFSSIAVVVVIAFFFFLFFFKLYLSFHPRYEKDYFFFLPNNCWLIISRGVKEEEHFKLLIRLMGSYCVDVMISMHAR